MCVYIHMYTYIYTHTHRDTREIPKNTYKPKSNRANKNNSAKLQG